MKKFILKYFNLISQSAFFKHNDFKANLIFVLCILFFIVAAEDLGSELAQQKDEVSYVVATLNESVDFLNFNTLVPLIYSPVVVAYLTVENAEISNDNSFDFSSGRSPPLS